MLTGEQREAIQNWHRETYGMTMEEFYALPWDTKVAMMQKAGVKFAGFGAGAVLVSKR